MNTAQIRPPNPGGDIAPADVVGRDQLVGRIWHVLERQSVLLSFRSRLLLRWWRMERGLVE